MSQPRPIDAREAQSYFNGLKYAREVKNQVPYFVLVTPATPGVTQLFFEQKEKDPRVKAVLTLDTFASTGDEGRPLLYDRLTDRVAFAVGEIYCVDKIFDFFGVANGSQFAANRYSVSYKRAISDPTDAQRIHDAFAVFSELRLNPEYGRILKEYAARAVQIDSQDRQVAESGRSGEEEFKLRGELAVQLKALEEAKFSQIMKLVPQIRESLGLGSMPDKG